jgi:hypothetical protein
MDPIQKAIQTVADAIALDGKKEWNEAFEVYITALDYFVQSIQQILNDPSKQ